ncbi:heparan-sulfate 6-O-sulfotransferase 2-like [Anneissia japonica]|uniref:heparan-sulfate 6-O-sulfotransferase 2-like n=1 Tax=Anneissia japonica TaxID=1529436 RepID=UPI001425AE9E|nr:heparan-sulfate 6-O-sulfotransferase 2-like [Anneissia japonica]XP_033118251.1 heparan-sulfate 6-O-sulfotransferase 2-like [Anneissia japonica]
MNNKCIGFIFLVVVTSFYLFYEIICSERFVCTSSTLVEDVRGNEFYSSIYRTGGNVSQSHRGNKPFSEKTLIRDFDFDINGDDVLVFLHIQKTGGTTFGKHLVKNMDMEKPCQCFRGKKRCDCLRPGSSRSHWLFSRYSTGWSCGLHADWTELTNCVPQWMDQKEKLVKKRRYYYITMLRHPVSRYLSEWRHVQRGATWKNSKHMCDGKQPLSHELPLCFSGEDWKDVELNEFMKCEYNLANNRQTRMLADLSVIGCYNMSFMTQEERNNNMLRSAKKNLRHMAYFGLTEYQKKSQFIFEKTFKLNFIDPFEQFNRTYAEQSPITDDQQQQIELLNQLDLELYAFAKKLFFQRYNKMKELFGSKNNNWESSSTSSSYSSSEDEDDELSSDDLPVG